MLRSRTIPVLPFQRGVSVRLFPIPYFAPPPSLAPLPSSSRCCQCGRPTTRQLVLKVLGRRMHWSRQQRGSAARQARVGTNIIVHDMDMLPQDHQDGRAS